MCMFIYISLNWLYSYFFAWNMVEILGPEYFDEQTIKGSEDGM
jgi:hypothetical protein